MPPFAPSALRFALACSFLVATVGAQRFDLADAIGRRNGEPPGQGQPFHYPILGGASQGQFFAEGLVPGVSSVSPFVHGIFIPQDTAVGMSHIADGIGGAPVMATVPEIGTVTSPPWASDGSPSNDGAIRINDPSGRNGHPDYTGSPYHSILATHAVIGVTFDLNVIRTDMNWPGPLQFTANPGGSCAPVSAVAVVVDVSDQPRVVFSQRDLSGNNLTPTGFLLNPTDKFLCLIGGDNGDDTINCKHAFWGDPFLVPACSGTVNEFGAGCATSSGQVPDLHVLGVPCLNLPFGIACEAPAGLSYVVNLGVSNTRAGALMLPFDLGTVGGGAGCLVLNSLEATTPTAQANTTAATLTTPNDTNLLGASLFLQAFVVDPGLGSAIQVATSESVELVFGT